VTLPRIVRVYDVRGHTIAGFRDVTLPRATTALASAPESFAFPTLADPGARRDLVRVLRGALADRWVSPDDPGIRWTPGR